jgi:hypothetical protein
MATLEQIKEKMKKLQTQADALTAKRFALLTNSGIVRGMTIKETAHGNP